MVYWWHLHGREFIVLRLLPHRGIVKLARLAFRSCHRHQKRKVGIALVDSLWTTDDHQSRFPMINGRSLPRVACSAVEGRSWGGRDRPPLDWWWRRASQCQRARTTVGAASPAVSRLAAESSLVDDSLPCHSGERSRPVRLLPYSPPPHPRSRPPPPCSGRWRTRSLRRATPSSSTRCTSFGDAWLA
jgi:hypothetical protein